MFNVKTPQLILATLGVALALSSAQLTWAMDFKGVKCGMGTYGKQDKIDILKLKMTERTSIANRSYYKTLVDQMRGAGFKDFMAGEGDMTVTLGSREEFIRFEQLIEANNGHMAIKDFEVLEYETELTFENGLPKEERDFAAIGPLVQETEVASENLMNTIGRFKLTNMEVSTLSDIAKAIKKAGLKVLSDNQATPAWVLRDLADPIDNLRWFVDKIEDVQAKNHLSGALVKTMKILKSRGVTTLNPVVGKNSGLWMDVQASEPSETIPLNKVTRVTSPAYLMGNYVIRTAKVLVSSGPAN